MGDASTLRLCQHVLLTALLLERRGPATEPRAQKQLDGTTVAKATLPARFSLTHHGLRNSLHDLMVDLDATREFRRTLVFYTKADYCFRSFTFVLSHVSTQC